MPFARLSTTPCAGLSAALLLILSTPAAAGETKLVPEENGKPDNYGNSVALSGETLVVGAPLADASDKGGAAYVYVREGVGVWTPTGQIVASDGTSGDHFGTSAGLDGDFAIFGAMFDGPGSAYIYRREKMGTWVPEGKLLAGDGGSGDFFGCSVAIDGDTALVGAYSNDKGGKNTGAAYIFTRDDNDIWTEKQQLIASDAKSSGGFGTAVALAGDRLVIGAPTDSAGELASGSVYVFVRDGMGVWSEEAKLVGSGITKHANLGTSVALDGERLLAGAPGFFHMGAYTGAAYLWHHDGIAWTEEERLVASDGEEGVYFGHSVALSGERALVGTINDNDKGKWSGAAYTFDLTDDVWLESEKWIASDAKDSTSLGSAVASDPATLVAGAAGGDAVYIFEGILSPGTPCEENELCSSGVCVDGVCCDQACGDGEGDCQACSIAAGSSEDGLCQPLAAEVECRAAADECDLSEVCDGESVECPADALAEDGAMCSDGVCADGLCEPLGTTGSDGTTGGSAGTSDSGTTGSDTSSDSGSDSSSDSTTASASATASGGVSTDPTESSASGDPSATDGGQDSAGVGDEGCGCRATSPQGGLSLLLVVLFGLGRRRRHT